MKVSLLFLSLLLISSGVVNCQWPIGWNPSTTAALSSTPSGPTLSGPSFGDQSRLLGSTSSIGGAMEPLTAAVVSSPSLTPITTRPEPDKEMPSPSRAFEITIQPKNIIHPKYRQGGDIAIAVDGLQGRTLHLYSDTPYSFLLKNVSCAIGFTITNSQSAIRSTVSPSVCEDQVLTWKTPVLLSDEPVFFYYQSPNVADAGGLIMIHNSVAHDSAMQNRQSILNDLSGQAGGENQMSAPFPRRRRRIFPQRILSDLGMAGTDSSFSSPINVPSGAQSQQQPIQSPLTAASGLQQFSPLDQSMPQQTPSFFGGQQQPIQSMEQLNQAPIQQQQPSIHQFSGDQSSLIGQQQQLPVSQLNQFDQSRLSGQSLSGQQLQQPISQFDQQTIQQRATATEPLSSSSTFPATQSVQQSLGRVADSSSFLQQQPIQQLTADQSTSPVVSGSGAWSHRLSSVSRSSAEFSPALQQPIQLSSTMPNLQSTIVFDSSVPVTVSTYAQPIRSLSPSTSGFSFGLDASTISSSPLSSQGAASSFQSTDSSISPSTQAILNQFNLQPLTESSMQTLPLLSSADSSVYQTGQTFLSQQPAMMYTLPTTSTVPLQAGLAGHSGKGTLYSSTIPTLSKTAIPTSTLPSTPPLAHTAYPSTPSVSYTPNAPAPVTPSFVTPASPPPSYEFAPGPGYRPRFGGTGQEPTPTPAPTPAPEPSPTPSSPSVPTPPPSSPSPAPSTPNSSPSGSSSPKMPQINIEVENEFQTPNITASPSSPHPIVHLKLHPIIVTGAQTHVVHIATPGKKAPPTTPPPTPTEVPTPTPSPETVSPATPAPFPTVPPTPQIIPTPAPETLPPTPTPQIIPTPAPETLPPPSPTLPPLPVPTPAPETPTPPTPAPETPTPPTPTEAPTPAPPTPTPAPTPAPTPFTETPTIPPPVPTPTIAPPLPTPLPPTKSHPTPLPTPRPTPSPKVHTAPPSPPSPPPPTGAKTHGRLAPASLSNPN